ncbi:hypothetical protein HOY80DRAFT_1029175 [Tuber brumale]|nr:hypothetical protein HOY80DRAFT_1029175 [Tuber brumale]
MSPGWDGNSWADSDVVYREEEGDADEEERASAWAMTPRDFHSSPQDQKVSIGYMLTKRRRFLAGNACLLIDLQAAARQDAEEPEIT